MIKGKLSYLNRIYSKHSFRYSVDADKISGSSPPSVFIGRKGYPKVFIGPLVPAVHGDTSIMDLPEAWGGKQAIDIIDFRLQLVRGKQAVRVSDVDKAQKVRDIALAKNPVQLDVEFEKKPRGVFFHEDMQPFGPSAQMKSMELDVGRYDPHMEKAHYDTDLLARDAMIALYEKSVFVSSIQKALSTAAFGLGRNRKLVPTRWSITAVDDTLGKHLLDKIKYYPVVDEYRVYEIERLHSKFVVLFMPQQWQYESMEAFFPQIIGDRLEIYSDWESYGGKKEYAAIGGCYYSARLAIAEQLEREKKQAGAIVFRECYSGYIPLGVWLVRECMRDALNSKAQQFENINSALTYISSRLRLPISKWKQSSTLLKQSKLTQFLKN